MDAAPIATCGNRPINLNGSAPFSWLWAETGCPHATSYLLTEVPHPKTSGPLAISKTHT